MGEDSSSSSQTNEFEFGSIKPTSQSTDPKGAISPADEFFLNGRLLPHSFPIQARTSTRRSSSCSISSKDSISLVSSRSSSASSSRSSTPTPRTSSCDQTERKAIQKKIVSKERLITTQGSKNGNKNLNYVSTIQKWQFIISPGPVLDPSFSRRRRSSGEFVLKLSPKKKIKEIDEDKGFCLRILRSFIKSCKACHAMEEGAAIDDNDLDSFVELK